ncbi:HEPN domain-containing protein [Candidatus Bathyarchaeota archaeon]|nr:HEPN domain-containing protein [Candidatus Bathyarchaeota archaeon]
MIDLEEAESALREGRPNWALFAAQQALEKCFKAAIMAKRRERPPGAHDLMTPLTIVAVRLARLDLRSSEE